MPDVERLSGGRVGIDTDPLPDGRRFRVLFAQAAELPRVSMIVMGIALDGSGHGAIRAALTADDCVAVAEWLLRYAQRVRPRE